MTKTAHNYVPPISPVPDLRSHFALADEPLDLGVDGYAYRDEKGRVVIPLIVAHQEGTGDVGKFLDSLSPRCVILNCCSARLRGMLQRRGWQETFEDMHGESIDVWVRS